MYKNDTFNKIQLIQNKISGRNQEQLQVNSNQTATGGLSDNPRPLTSVNPVVHKLKITPPQIPSLKLQHAQMMQIGDVESQTSKPTKKALKHNSLMTQSGHLTAQEKA